MTQLTKNWRPQAGEHAAYFENYIRLVPEGDVVAQLAEQVELLRDVVTHVSDETANQVHPPYTWTIKQVVGHLIDCERVFGYRAARFAAADQTPLPSFDENRMIAESDYKEVSLSDLYDEWRHLRRANLLFFHRLTDEQWMRCGVSSNEPMSVRAVAFILVGHTIHHLRIVRKRLQGWQPLVGERA